MDSFSVVRIGIYTTILSSSSNEIDTARSRLMILVYVIELLIWTFKLHLTTHALLYCNANGNLRCKDHLDSIGKSFFLSIELAVNCYYVFTYLALIFPFFNKDYTVPYLFIWIFVCYVWATMVFSTTFFAEIPRKSIFT